MHHPRPTNLLIALILLLLAAPSTLAGQSSTPIMVAQLVPAPAPGFQLEAVQITFEARSFDFTSRNMSLKIFEADLSNDGTPLTQNPLFVTVLELEASTIIPADAVWIDVPADSQIWQTVEVSPPIANTGSDWLLITLDTTLADLAGGEVAPAWDVVPDASCTTFYSQDSGLNWSKLDDCLVLNNCSGGPQPDGTVIQLQIRPVVRRPLAS